MAKRGRRGAEATAKRLRSVGLAIGDLGELETHADARRWLRLIGEGVLTGRLGHREAAAGVRVIEAWLRALSEELGTQVIAELRAEVESLKEEVVGGYLSAVP